MMQFIASFDVWDLVLDLLLLAGLDILLKLDLGKLMFMLQILLLIFVIVVSSLGLV